MFFCIRLKRYCKWRRAKTLSTCALIQCSKTQLPYVLLFKSMIWYSLKTRYTQPVKAPVNLSDSNLCSPYPFSLYSTPETLLVKAFLPHAASDPILLHRSLCRCFASDPCYLLNTPLCKRINENAKPEGQKCAILGPEKRSSSGTRFCRHSINGYEGRKATVFEVGASTSIPPQFTSDSTDSHTVIYITWAHISKPEVETVHKYNGI